MLTFFLPRLGEMSEVAAAVTFLASKDAAFINATDLKVANNNVLINLHLELYRLMEDMVQ